jgi:polyhydroxybutyrate depolymerase
VQHFRKPAAIRRQFFGACGQFRLLGGTKLIEVLGREVLDGLEDAGLGDMAKIPCRRGLPPLRHVQVNCCRQLARLCLHLVRVMASMQSASVAGQQGLARQYKVHVPPGYDPNVPMPLVFCFHGLDQNAVMFCVNGAGFNAKSDAENFILVMPNGYDHSWNAGTCCGDAASMKLDDVALVRAIFTEVGKHLNIDLGRVYAVGLSNGAFLSYRLGCEAADVFVAIVPGSGGIMSNDMNGGQPGESDFPTCQPAQAVSVLDTHGTWDAYVPYAYQKPSLDRMAVADHCSADTEAAQQPPSGGDTTCITYKSCPAGLAVTGCTIQGGGHCWFGSVNCGTGVDIIGNLAVGANSDFMKNTDQAWAFLSQKSR